MYERKDYYAIVRMRDGVELGMIAIPHGWFAELKVYAYDNHEQRKDVAAIMVPYELKRPKGSKP
jgi:hypothetical protein